MQVTINGVKKNYSDLTPEERSQVNDAIQTTKLGCLRGCFTLCFWIAIIWAIVHYQL